MRRLGVTALAVALLLLLWLFFLWLDQTGRFEWSWPTRALGAVGFGAWMWMGALVFTLLLRVMAFTLFGVPATPSVGGTSLRQVQCDNCKAVFFIRDSGARPLSHPCPSCKVLGVYDGTAAPVGAAPKPRMAKQIVQVNLTCRTCSHRFQATDLGVRPMKIACPNCKAVGEIF